MADDLAQLREKLRDKDIANNKLTDIKLFQMDNKWIMQSDINNYFSKRGRKTKEEKEMYKKYQDYLISKSDFKIAHNGDLGMINYRNGIKYPVICIVDGYKFSESAIAYLAGKEEKTPEAEVAVMIGKAEDLIPLGEGETIKGIKKKLGI